MKKWWCSFLSGFCFCVFWIGSLFIGLIVFPCIVLSCNGHKQRQKLVNTIRQTWRFFIWLMEKCKLIQVEAFQIPQTTGNIIVANHPSLIDIVILIAKIPNCICIVKTSLKKHFFMKYIVRKVYLINDMDADALFEETQKLLNDGFNLVVFPEGTRTTKPVGEIKLHRGVAHLAIHTNAPIVAYHISNNPPILGKKQRWFEMASVPSVYQLFLQNTIVFKSNPNLSNYSNAKLLTDQIKKAIFSIK